MSCVIQIKDKDRVIFISDSRSSTDIYNVECANGIDSKMVRYFQDKDSLIGHVGNARDISIIKQIPGLFTDYSDKYPVFDYDYVRNVMLPKIRKEFAELGIYPSETTNKIPTRLMVARNDKCFLISESGCVIEVDDFHIDGSGSYGALGSMLASKETDPIIKGLKAMRAAIKYNVYCGYPVLVSTTKDNKDYVLSKEDVDAIIEGRKELK